MSHPGSSLIVVPWKHFRCGLCYLQHVSVFGGAVSICSTLWNWWGCFLVFLFACVLFICSAL